jgi:ribonuclease BN (tRNA processing enzyme)
VWVALCCGNSNSKVPSTSVRRRRDGAASATPVRDSQNGSVSSPGAAPVTVTFAGSGDAFGSGGRYQACIHLQGPDGAAPVLLDCGATSLSALRRSGLDPGEIAAVFVSHLHGDHFGGLPFLILNAQFAGRTRPLTVIGPPGIAGRLHALMECMFPGSSAAARRFPVDTVELRPGAAVTVAGVRAAAWQADHPSGGPALALRLTLGGRVIGYTGDTAWTDVLIEVAAGADLLIAEAYYRDKNVPFHLRHADLAAHRGELASRRIVLTHMSADMLEHLDQACFEAAEDGLVLHI